MDSRREDLQFNSIPQEDLINFFHRKKTEISCQIDDPLTFLSQLRDNSLVPENVYQKAIKKKSKDAQQKCVYEILDWLERERGQYIKLFWSCVFKDHVLLKNPFLGLLKSKLLEECSRSDVKLPRAGRKTGNEEKKVEQKQFGSKRKRVDDEANEENAGPSVTSSSLKKPRVLYSLDYYLDKSSEELKEILSKNEDRGQEEVEEEEKEEEESEESEEEDLGTLQNNEFL